MSILVLGSISFDAIETPFSKVDKILGGSAVYTSLAASYFTKQSHSKLNLVGVVGGDFLKSDIALLQQHGVNTAGLQIKQNEKSFFWKGRYHYDMNKRDTLVVASNVMEKFDPMIPPSYQDCEFLILGSLSPSIQKQVINRLNKRPRLIVMDTIDYWIDRAWDTVMKVIQTVDILSINEAEARKIAQEYMLAKAAQKILAMGPRYLVIKKGAHGALLFDKNHTFYAPAFPLKDMTDPTGAGDAFTGGLVGHLVRCASISFEDMKVGVMIGSAIASFCVEKFGPEKLIHLTQEAINKRIQQLVALVQFKKELSGSYLS